MRRIALALLLAMLLTNVAIAADVYQTGRIVKWENATYPNGKKTKGWIVYQLQGETMLYSIARQKETKPRMQPGDVVQYRLKGNQMVVINPQNKKEQYQIVGQSQAQAPPQ
jgi:hypothetical protein